MENQAELFKGELMEELLRQYFLDAGYYVLRGVKFRYQSLDLTDVDLFLYRRNSNLSRERVNVDIKNRKSPQAFERILWANGIMKLLGFDHCVVGTKDTRPVIHSFAKLHNTTLLDGTFLGKLKHRPNDRLSEEELSRELATVFGTKAVENKDWRYVYEMSKSRLLNEQDFSGLNSTLATVSYFIEASVSDEKKKELATRMVYATISHLLIILDYILKDIWFLDGNERQKRISEGLTFGNLGKEGVNKIIGIATQISGNRSAGSFLNSLRSVPLEILTDFFTRTDGDTLFTTAKTLENLAYQRNFVAPSATDASIRSILSVLVDYCQIERRTYFDNVLPSQKIQTPNLDNRLEIISAFYGTERNSVDVTDTVRMKVAGGKLDFIASNDVFGDPDPGVVKIFKMTYRAKMFGESKILQVKEGEKVVLEN